MPYGYSKKTGLPFIPPTRKGIKLSDEICEKIKLNNAKYWLGKKRSETTKQILSKIGMAKKGENTNNWKGGKPKCPDCGITVSYTSKYCKKDIWNHKKTWNYKGGISKTQEYRNYIQNKREAKKRIGGGSFSFEQWVDLKKKYNYICLCCKQQEPFIVLSIDHIVPISMGGTNDISNIQPLCRKCNSQKYTKFIDYRIDYELQ